MTELYIQSDKKPQFEISNNKNLIFTVHVRTYKISKIFILCMCVMNLRNKAKTMQQNLLTFNILHFRQPYVICRYIIFIN